MSWIVRLLVVTIVVFLASKYIPGIQVESLTTALIAAVVLGLINLFIRPLLMILTLPINLITLGLFTLVINAVLFWVTGALVDGFDVDGFIPAFLGALVVSIAIWITDRFTH